MKKQKKASLKASYIKLISVVLAIIAVFAGLYFGYAYLADYYHAIDIATEACKSTDDVRVVENKHEIIFYPSDYLEGDSKNTTEYKGFIFYPGGKVEDKAYAPLMQELAKNGYVCILVHMPFNLAVFDIDAAKGYQEQFPNIKKWYLGGHSLGAAMSATYINKHADKFDGLVLCGGYSTKDLTDTNLTVLSIYGENDGVMNRKSYAKYQKNLPSDTTEIIIDGGCHAYFGAYGPQKGDGEPTISEKEQIQMTADYIINLLD